MTTLQKTNPTELVISEHHKCKVCASSLPYLFQIKALGNYPVCKSCIGQLVKQFMDYIHG